MSTHTSLLQHLDDKLRTGLLSHALPRILVGILTLIAFFLLMMTRTLPLLAGAPLFSRICTAILFCIPLSVLLTFALNLKNSSNSTLSQLGLCALCVLAMLARVSFLDRSSGDYDIYLSDWLTRLANGSFREGMRANIGEYNVLYQYILFVITRLPIPSLYAVKVVSFIGDAFLAGACAHLTENRKIPVFGAVLLLPTLVLNGGMFAQCDSLYTACALWGLAWALDQHPMRSAVCFALALAFKLQSAFLLPIVIVLWADRKLTLRDALVFLLTLLIVALPALVGGKSVGNILRIYTAQTGLYTGLTYQAASFFGLMDTTDLDVYAYGNFAMALAMGACALLVLFGLQNVNSLQKDGYVRLALLMVLTVVFLLPRMHERYFYMAIPLSAVWATRRGGKAVAVCALIELAMLATHWALFLSQAQASCLMLTALILLLTDSKSDCGPIQNVV